MDFIEAAGTVTGVFCVWFFIRQNIWAWSMAAVSAILFGIVFYTAGLYSNMALQGFYVALAAYGWHQWRRGGAEQSGVRVHRLTLSHGVILGLAVVIMAVAGVVILTWITQNGPITARSVIVFLTEEQARSADALATAMSLAGTWMQAKKILENWLLWIITDMLLVGVFFSQGLYFTTALYVLYLGMATMGFMAWKKDLQKHTPSP